MFLPGVDAFHVYVRAWAFRLLPLAYQYPNLSEGADRVGGQLRGDKECHLSGVTKSSRDWRKVPESDARSVGPPHPYPPNLHTEKCVALPLDFRVSDLR